MLRPRRASDVRSLFGATPEQIRQKRYEDQMEFLAQQQSGFGKAGAALGMGLAQLFGAPDKELQEAEQRQETVKGIDELGAMAEAEAAQRGMAPLSMTEPDVLAREANRLESVSTAFRNLGQDTGELDNEVLRLRVEADKATRARELDDLRRKNTELQIERGEFDLGAKKEDRDLVKQSNKLRFEILGLNKQIAEGKITNEKEQKEKVTRVRNNTVKFFEGIDGADQYAELVRGEILSPEKAIDAWQKSLANKSLDITEIGPYTKDGQEIIGAVDKTTGTLYQLTDRGWLGLPSEGWTQGPPTAEGSTPTIKQGRSISGQVRKDYDKILEEQVDPGSWFTSEAQVLAQQATGIEDINSDTGRQELYRRAEQIFANNPGVTEKEALERALTGERVTAPSSGTQTTTQTPGGDPFAGKTIKEKD